MDNHSSFLLKDLLEDSDIDTIKYSSDLNELYKAKKEALDILGIKERNDVTKGQKKYLKILMTEDSALEIFNKSYKDQKEPKPKKEKKEKKYKKK